MQPPQSITVGKRATLWIRDLIKAFVQIEGARDDIEFRGYKGTTETQVSFLQLFDQNRAKVQSLSRFATRKTGFIKLATVD